MEIEAGDQYFHRVWSDQVDSSRIKSYESHEQHKKYKNLAKIGPDQKNKNSQGKWRKNKISRYAHFQTGSKVRSSLVGCRMRASRNSASKSKFSLNSEPLTEGPRKNRGYVFT